MRITSLSLRNWRTFKNLRIPVGQRLIVIGPNASGKSNLLDSIRFLRDLAGPGGGLQDAVGARGGLSRVRCLFARNNNHGHVSVEVSLGDDDEPQRWTYELSFRGEGAGRNRVVVATEVVRDRGAVVLNRPDSNDEDDPERLTQTALEQISANKDFREVAEFLAATRYLHLVPQVIRDSSRAGTRPDDPFGGDFIARMNAVPVKTRDAWLRRVTDALQVAVPQFESLSITQDTAGRPHLESRYTNWRSSGARQDESDFSDGTLRLIGLLWSLVEVQRRGAPVLLEEPELSLHPEVVRMLPSVLARAQRGGAQVILTTHSPDLLSDESVGPDEVLVLEVGNDGTTGYILAEDEDALEDIHSGLTVAEVGLPRSRPQGVERLARIDLASR
ncbi:chromosome segregation protein SMC [Geodermatophilus sp. TF02-6]|uniref:AAA family ATPase n=1 Tax=Geodermatophilus sp. TF02-6 TaxID=2250575 RepID=UPI000DEB8799|nr:ATP-binding protein [Geodermatophilus sp. TF02-6]RBY80541.1 chromosome segregation protein SMC [Geodermatophilus sp. TF02-6]